ncbi:uncharacterized protein WM294_014755 [Sarcoramphus papa]
MNTQTAFESLARPAEWLQGIKGDAGSLTNLVVAVSSLERIQSCSSNFSSALNSASPICCQVHKDPATTTPRRMTVRSLAHSCSQRRLVRMLGIKGNFISLQPWL